MPMPLNIANCAGYIEREDNMRVQYTKGPNVAGFILAVLLSIWFIHMIDGWPLLVNIASRIIFNLLH